MIGIVSTYGGKDYQLPTLYSWEFSYTGNVPCDSFVLRCPYEAEMAETLRSACRFTAKDNAVTAFCGVIDEVNTVCDEKGLALELSGRGMAALLLDNEAESAVYQCATTKEILQNHVMPYGITCSGADEIKANELYKITSGSSQWKALSDFTRYYGGFVPYFLKDGTMCLKKKLESELVVIDGNTPVTEITYRDTRYGVISEAVVIDKSTKVRQTVRNSDFCARGGMCRRIFYAPGHSTTQALRYTGEYQIEKSRENTETLSVKIAGVFDIAPQQRVQVSYSKLGVTGSFTVTEVVCSMGEHGETTRVKMQRE